MPTPPGARVGHSSAATMHTSKRAKSGKQTIIITEVPYQVLRSTITEKIASCRQGGRTFRDIASVNDASDRKHPVRIEVDLRKDANVDVVINQLCTNSPRCRATSRSSTSPWSTVSLKTLGLKDLLRHVRRTSAGGDQDDGPSSSCCKARQKAHVLEGLILAVGDIDEIIRLIKESPDPPTAKERLMARELLLTEDEALRRLLPDKFIERAGSRPQQLTAIQAGAILSMQLQRLTGLEVTKLATDYSALVEEIEGYEAILRDEALVLDIIREDLYELKDKYGQPRRTEIVEAVGDFAIEELIPEEQMVVTISHLGYVKRVDADTYRKQGRGGRGVRGGEAREGDFLEHLFVVSTHDYLLFFTSRGRVYWARVFDLPAQARTARGRSIANLLKMQDNETLCAVLRVKQFEEQFVFFATAKGTVKKTPMGAFSRPRPSGIIAITLDPDDVLIGVERTSGDDEVVLGSHNGMAVRFSEQDVRAMGRGARGVRGMTLERDDQVVDMIAIQPGSSVLTVCENGFGKRTDIDEYRLTKRGGKGVINIKVTQRNGQVVALKAVRDEDELMIITAGGIMLRTDLTEIREIGRATQGVRLIRPDEGDRVVAVAKIAQEEPEEIPSDPAPDAPLETSANPPPEASADVPPEPEPEADEE